ncbi:MAG: hypothetical protein KAI47_06840, partial [Deltaproteobacteria bacterium]|nr:hypothetical protein [Deltaproteobacteria bacterium]
SVILVAATAFLSSGSAGAYPLTAWSKTSLKKDFAKTHSTTVKQIEKLKIYNLKSAKGVRGFTLGRYRSKSGKWSYAGITVYHACGAKLCLASLSLGGAQRVRAVRLLDLTARQTVIRVARGPWFASHRGHVTEPLRPPRWPVLVLQTERIYGHHKSQEVHFISLKSPGHPLKLAAITTLSTHATPIGKGRTSPRRRQPRYTGTRVTLLRAIKTPGKPPRLLVKEKMISSRFNRCKEPKAVPTTYDLKKGRFVRQFRGLRRGGCR